MQLETKEPIIACIVEYFKTCPYLHDGYIGVDNLEDKLSYSIDPQSCDPWYKRYVDGGGIRQFEFNITSKEYCDGDVRTMIENSGFYQNLNEWLESNNMMDIMPELDGYQAIKVVTLMSGYLFSTDADYARYQIQLRMLYE